MYTIFGFDRISRKLLSPDCTADEWQKGIDLVRMNEDAGIHFYASFGIGFDEQDKGVFDRILKFSEESGIDLAEFYIITPFQVLRLGSRWPGRIEFSTETTLSGIMVTLFSNPKILQNRNSWMDFIICGNPFTKTRSTKIHSDLSPSIRPL